MWPKKKHPSTITQHHYSALNRLTTLKRWSENRINPPHTPLNHDVFNPEGIASFSFCIDNTSSQGQLVVMVYDPRPHHHHSIIGLQPRDYSTVSTRRTQDTLVHTQDDTVWPSEIPHCVGLHVYNPGESSPHLTTPHTQPMHKDDIAVFF